MLNFENQDQLNNLSLNFSGTRTEEVKQNIPTIKNEEFATINEGVQDMAHMLKEQKEPVALL